MFLFQKTHALFIHFDLVIVMNLLAQLERCDFLAELRAPLFYSWGDLNVKGFWQAFAETEKRKNRLFTTADG